MDEFNISELIKNDSTLTKIVTIFKDPFQAKPSRFIHIQNIIDKYIPDENVFNNIVIKKITDKYKNELKDYKYVNMPRKLLTGQQIIYVSRKNFKISKIVDIIDYKFNDFGEIVAIIVKSKRAKVTKNISFLKNYIFKYIPFEERSNLRNIIENIT